MGRPEGSHTRHSRPRREYRGSRRRIDNLKPFEHLSSDFWWIVVVALIMFAISVKLILNAL